jgi:PTH2 family peptidyl-tRNA hydrolase
MTTEERQSTMAKQVIVVNRNLNMPQGKLAAQCAHASLAALFKCGTKDELALHIELEQSTAVEQWLNGSFTKIVLYVKSQEKLLSVFEKAKDAGLPCALITDAGYTVFDGVPTHTCVGIGPVYPKQLIGITDKLRVL